MVDQRTRAILKSSSWSFFLKIIIFSGHVFCTAMISRGFSKEEFGIWVVLSQLSVLLSILDLGMGGSALRNALTTLSSHRKDREAKDLFLEFFWALLFLYLALGVVTILLGFFVDWQKIFVIQDHSVLKNLSWLLLFASIGTSIKFGLNIASTGFLAYGETHIKLFFDAIEILSVSFLAATIFYIKGTLAQFTAAYFLFGIFFSWLVLFIFMRKRWWLFSWIRLEQMISAMIPLWKTSALFWLQNLCTLGAFSFIPTLIGMRVGVAEAGEYSLLQRLFTMLIGAHFILLNPLWTGYTQAWAQRDFIWIKKLFYQSKVTTLLLFGLLLPFMIWFAPGIIKIWSGNLIHQPLLVLLIGVWTLCYGWINCHAVLLNSANKVGGQVVFLLIACIILVSSTFSWCDKNVVNICVAASLALLPCIFFIMFETKKLLLIPISREI